MNVFIDTASISEQFYLDQDQVNSLMDYTIKEITARFAEQWEQEAIRSLSSSRQQYINGLVVVDEGFAKGAVVLVGELPNMVEQGANGFDMKEGYLNGPNAKIGSNGNRYNTIPFSVGTPGALQENFNGGIMPQEVYDVVKTKPEGQPLQQKEIPQQFRQPQKKMIQLPESKSFVEYQHKKSIYEGISKQKDSVTGQTSYKSFRRVSDNSQENSWIHPGIEAHNISDKVLSEFNVEVIVGRALDTFLSQL